jgi:NADH-quinone oxidoreductase subunit M
MESTPDVYINRSKLAWVEEVLIFEPSYFIDAISIIFTLLTLFLIPICILLSWDNMGVNFFNYGLIFCSLQFFLINVFCSGDLFSFYIFFEAIIIPMYLLIGVLGSRRRRIHASFMFFFYTLAGSLLLLFAIIMFNYQYGTTNVLGLVKEDILPLKECFLWVCFFVAFAVKIPLMPVHLWLPEAHVESPTGGSVALAGILLKLGTYGMLRFLLHLFPFGSQFFLLVFFLVV